MEGKPGNPPTLHANYVGCVACAARYVSATHLIHFVDDWPVRTWLFLHETAHALAAGHLTISECLPFTGQSRSRCVHGDCFRCTAEFL